MYPVLSFLVVSFVSFFAPSMAYIQHLLTGLSLVSDQQGTKTQEGELKKVTLHHFVTFTNLFVNRCSSTIMASISVLSFCVYFDFIWLVMTCML